MKKTIILMCILGCFTTTACKKKASTKDPQQDPNVEQPQNDTTKNDNDNNPNSDWDTTLSMNTDALRLYENLKNLANQDNIIVGHQGSSIAGADGWRLWQYPDGNRSDFHDISGKYPGVYGWELAHRSDDATQTYDYISLNTTIEQAKIAYNKGAINTFATHPFRIDNNNGSWDVTPGYVTKILPGGMLHNDYKAYLDIWANALLQLKVNNNGIPFIFRPYHEMDGNWFWWGANSCSDEEYKKLFRFTVFYLRNKGLTNMLVCYSPALAKTEQEYLKRYPGDDVVDILGFDHYYKSDEPNSINGDPNWDNFKTKLNLVSSIANTKNKLASISETGQQNITSNDYFNQLHTAISSTTAKVAYTMFWANYSLNVGNDGSNGFYIPHQNSSNAHKDDFNTFLNMPKYKTASNLNIYN